MLRLLAKRENGVDEMGDGLVGPVVAILRTRPPLGFAASCLRVAMTMHGYESSLPEIRGGARRGRPKRARKLGKALTGRHEAIATSGVDYFFRVKRLSGRGRYLISNQRAKIARFHARSS